MEVKVSIRPDADSFFFVDFMPTERPNHSCRVVLCHAQTDGQCPLLPAEQRVVRRTDCNGESRA